MVSKSRTTALSSLTSISIFLAPLILVSLIPLSILSDSAEAQEEKPAVIKKIIIQGNNLIEEETIRTNLQTIEGSYFDPEIVSEDIRSLHRMGYFEDVQVDAVGFEGGLAVTFTIKEKPLITRVDFEGNKEVKTEDFMENIDVKPNTVVDDYEIRSTIEEVLFFLHEKGYYEATVDYRLDPITEGEYSLVFIVDEGPKLMVGKIEIIGNEEFSDRQIKKAMKTKEKGILSLFTARGKLKTRELEEDGLRILAFLYNNGHLKAKVDDPQISIDKEKNEITVTVTLTEGPRYRVGELNVTGDEYYTTEKILKEVKTAPGKVFKRDDFAKDILAVTTLYTDIGYAYANVDTPTELDDEQALVNITMSVDKGPLVNVGRIYITGNTITRDNVIRREIQLKEGELFSSKDLAQSRQRLMNLGYFDKVDVTTEPGPDDLINIAVNVEERLTGTLTFGGGYSSEDGVGGIIRLTQDNLWGRGQKIQVSAEINQKSQEFNIYFADPAVFDSPYSFAIRTYNETREWDAYDEQSTGGNISVGRSLGGLVRGSLTYTLELVDVFNVIEDASPIIKSQEGENLTSKFTLRLHRDTRNHFFNPTRGSRHEVRGEWAGSYLGGDIHFQKYEAESVFYFPLFWKLVLSLHGEAGIIEGLKDEEVPIYELFFAGGLYSIRGLERRQASPKDETGEPIGGHKKVVFNVETIFPIAEAQGLLGLFFFDAGYAFDNDLAFDEGRLRTSIGAGIRWLSPFGPFRLEYGYNVDPEPGEPGGQWQFSVGTAW
jgi:outer membrane protein insertion porin family